MLVLVYCGGGDASFDKRASAQCPSFVRSSMGNRAWSSIGCPGQPRRWRHHWLDDKGDTTRSVSGRKKKLDGRDICKHDHVLFQRLLKINSGRYCGVSSRYYVVSRCCLGDFTYRISSTSSQWYVTMLCGACHGIWNTSPTPILVCVNNVESRSQ